jgi:hypothetical protein
MGRQLHHQFSNETAAAISANYDLVLKAMELYPDDMRRLVQGSGMEHIRARTFMRALGSWIVDIEAPASTLAAVPDAGISEQSAANHEAA